MPMFKYLMGHPRQYRFDAKEGTFNINGDPRTSFKKLTFQPFAWRIFSDNILNMGTKNWAEMYFIDDQACVSAILFHGYSVDNIFRLIEPLFYDDLMMADVVITVIPEKKENTKITPKGVYYIATFEYETADPARVKLLNEYATDFKIYRQETLTDIANTTNAYMFFNPYLGEVMNGNLGDYVPTESPAPPALFLDAPLDVATK